MRKAAPYITLSMAIVTLAAGTAQGEIPWQKNLRSAHAQAQADGKLLLLHFYSDNCTWCDKLEEGSFKAPEVNHAINESFVPVKIHANSSPKLTEMFQVSKFPTDVIVTTDGRTLAHTVSPQNPERYVAMLQSTLPAIATQIATAPDAQVATAPAASAPAVTVEAPQAETPIQQQLIQQQSGLTAQNELTLPELNGTAATFAGNRQNDTSFELPSLNSPNIPRLENAEAAISSPSISESEISLPSQAQISQEQISQSEINGAELALPAEVAAPATSAADMPIEQPELAMQGYCAVTVINEDKWVEGSPEFGVIHLGKLYMFTSEENMNKFLANPMPYTPVLNEIDVVRFFEERKIVPGKREWGLKDPIHNRMFFFADEAAMNHFYNEYERYTDAAIEVMAKAVQDANPGT